MATPRIFVSSTCYDLYEVRNNLRGFISNFEYEPVMSEFGDIFYDYSLHVQDACLKEIEKCQMFVLIVGNNYGSFYHKTKGNEKNPPSVTFEEFKKALKTNVAKHIFINKLVKYDYDNYRRFLESKYKKYFSENNVEDNEVDKKKEEIRQILDKDYPFNHESYKHIFRFLDIIYDVNLNNAILTFETSIDIQGQLKRQWSGFMYEKLESIKNGSEIEQEINTRVRIENITSILEKLVLKQEESTQEENTLTKIENKKNNLDEVMNRILFNPDSTYDDASRGQIHTPISEDNTIEWLEKLNNLVDLYKWSKNIDFENVFSIYETYSYVEDKDIQYQDIYTLNTIYRNVESSEKTSFILAVMNKLKAIEKCKDPLGGGTLAQVEEEDELPF